VTFKSLVALTKAKEEAVREALAQAADAGEAFRWPDFRGSQYFWSVDADQKAAEEILKAVSTVPLSKAELEKTPAKHLPGFSNARIKAKIDALLGEKQLQPVPGFSSRAKLLIRSGDRETYVRAARAFVEDKIRKAGFASEGVFTEDVFSQSPAHGDATALILDAVKLLEPVRGVPVSTLRLRNHLPNLSKQQFDLAALELRKRQQVYLNQHTDPYNQSESDKELLIDGQDGTYYVAISIR
jgi:hypothetical protein